MTPFLPGYEPGTWVEIVSDQRVTLEDRFPTSLFPVLF